MNVQECENMTILGCPARDTAKNLMLQEMMESKYPEDIEMCKEQCCQGCEKSCGYRCGRCYGGNV